MRRISVLLPAFLFSFLCLTGCRLHDDYTGEPFLRVEYSVNGKHFEYEDWGEKVSTLFGSKFQQVSDGNGLQMVTKDANTSVASFSIGTEYMSLYLESPGKFFVDGKRYQFAKSDTAPACLFLMPYEAYVTEGWFSLHKKTVEPYCRYDIRFQFHCKGANDDYDVIDGIVQVGRRFQDANSRQLILSSTEEAL